MIRHVKKAGAYDKFCEWMGEHADYLHQGFSNESVTMNLHALAVALFLSLIHISEPTRLALI
eukprot:1703843-Alexandrium_andersonii.AAC.1